MIIKEKVTNKENHRSTKKQIVAKQRFQKVVDVSVS